MEPSLILVTGASGFVGRHFVGHLAARGHAVRPVGGRRARGAPEVPAADLADPAPWPRLLEGVGAVVHLAAYNPPPRVRFRRSERDAFRSINVEATARLAAQAAAAGVARFVFLSSMRVYGGSAPQLLTEESPLGASDEYGRSKREAEEALAAALAGQGTALTILRPPVIYGAGRGGVLGLLDSAVRVGMPLPLKGVTARRSLVYVGNISSAVEACLADPRAAGRTFNVSDGSPWTYGELAMLLAGLHGKRPHLVAPPPGYRLLGHLPGPGRLARRMLAPFACDDRLIRDTLGWNPPFTTAEALRLSFAPGAGGT